MLEHPLDSGRVSGQQPSSRFAVRSGVPALVELVDRRRQVVAARHDEIVRNRSRRRRVGEVVESGDHAHHGIEVVARLEGTVGIRRPVDERVHRGGVAGIDPAQRRTVAGSNRRDDEVETVIGHGARCRQRDAQSLKGRVAVFVGVTPPGIEVVNGEEPSLVTVVDDPVVAPEPDRGVLERFGIHAPAICEQARQRQVGDALRPREHSTRFARPRCETSW